MTDPAIPRAATVVAMPADIVRGTADQVYDHVCERPSGDDFALSRS